MSVFRCERMGTCAAYETGRIALTSQIAISNTVPLTKIDAQEIKAVLSEYRMNSCAVTIHQPDATIEDFIDVVEGNR